MTEQFQMRDTQQLQFDSLLAVMETLSYRIDRAGRDGDIRKATGGFITDNPALNANRNIGINTAVRIHNSELKDWKEVAQGWYQLDLKGVNIVLSAYALNILFAHKLVDKVKFIKNRKSPSHIVLQSHMVKPAKKEYTPLFGLVP